MPSFPTIPPAPSGNQEDWSLDDSFEFDTASPSQFKLPSSPSHSPSPSSSSSSSRVSRNSIGGGGGGGGGGACGNRNENVGSPLRNAFESKSGARKSLGSLGKAEDEGGDVDEDGFDLPDTFTQKAESIRKSLELGGRLGELHGGIEKSKSLKNVSATVIGKGPQGIGTITKLGSTSHNASKNSKGLPIGTVKAKIKAIEKSWEDDLDFGEEEELIPAINVKSKGKLSLKTITIDEVSGFGPTLGSMGSMGNLGNLKGLSTKGFVKPVERDLPGIDALDVLDDLFDDEDEDNQATLKAGDTLKAKLPPPASSKAKVMAKKTEKKEMEETDLLEDEQDLVLPLNLKNLTLVSNQSSTKDKPLRPRQSNSSVHTDWDTPSSPTASSGKPTSSSSRKLFSPPSSSPAGTGRRSETSATTSMSDDIATPIKKGFNIDHQISIGEENDDGFSREEEDMMTGLIFDPSFFDDKRSKELNRILDQKRKPQFAPHPHSNLNSHPHHSHKSSNSQNQGGHGGHGGHKRSGTGDTVGSNYSRGGEESMEEGLLFEPSEISGSRLRASRKARNGRNLIRSSTVNAASGGPSSASGSGGLRGLMKSKEKEKQWEKEREANWGRHTPLPPPIQRTNSSLGLTGIGGVNSTGYRSHSASAATGTNTQRPQSPHVPLREMTRPRTQSVMNMPPPPLPPVPSIPSTPSSRLRHQKSHYNLAAQPPESPSTLSRKQSLSSLQDMARQQSHPRTQYQSFSIETPQRPILPVPPGERYHNSTSRLTMPTSSSLAKTRPPISHIFPTSTSKTSMKEVVPSQMLIPLGGKRRDRDLKEQKKRHWGDGTELEGIEDLMVDDNTPSIGLGRPNLRKGESSRGIHTQAKETEKRKKSAPGTDGKGSLGRKRGRKPAGLIKHLGTVDKKKVVGEMTWNPEKLRWEGNESILKEFDSIPSNPSSTRPALITHYTGGSTSSLTSPSGPTFNTIRIVGDMKFDPEKMCWVSLGEEEPDPFEGMADDEDDEQGGTITRLTGRKLVSIGMESSATTNTSNWSSRFGVGSQSSAGASSTGWDGPASLGISAVSGGGTVIISDELWKECKEAEERHKKEVKGWVLKYGNSKEEIKEKARREEKRLWEIRNLAMKS